MKGLLSITVLGFAIASSAISLTAQGAQKPETDQAREEAMKDCFRKHGQLMDKPAVKNMRDCWRVHGYKMERS